MERRIPQSHDPKTFFPGMRTSVWMISPCTTMPKLVIAPRCLQRMICSFLSASITSDCALFDCLLAKCRSWPRADKRSRDRDADCAKPFWRRRLDEQYFSGTHPGSPSCRKRERVVGGVETCFGADAVGFSNCKLKMMLLVMQICCSSLHLQLQAYLLTGKRQYNGRSQWDE